MCLWHGADSQTSLRLTFIHTDSTMVGSTCCCSSKLNDSALSGTCRKKLLGMSEPRQTGWACLCSCHGVDSQKSLKWTFIDKDSRLHCFCAVNMWRTASMIEVFGILLHNHCLQMCISAKIDTHKSLTFKFIHTDSRFHWFDALNFSL